MSRENGNNLGGGSGGDSGLIADFLGSGADIGGPFALLGLGHAGLNDEVILRACQRRLRKISGHRRGNTPAGDEVRMAVHAAASQLLDVELRAELIRIWPEGVPEVEHESPKAWGEESVGVLDDRLKEQAMMLLGACGGWNARSRKRLGQFARMNRLSAAELVAGIVGESVGVAGGDGGLRNGDRSGDDGGVYGPSLIDPVAESFPWAMIPVAYVCMALALIWAGYAKDGFSSGGGVEAVESVVGGVESVVVEPGGAEGVGKGGERQRAGAVRRHFSAILFELEQIRRDGVFGVEEAERFSDVGVRLVDQWTEFGAEDLDRAVAAVVGVFDGILSAEVFDAASGFLVDPAEEQEELVKVGLRLWLFGGGNGGGNGGGWFERFGKRDQSGLFVDGLWVAFERAADLSQDDDAWWSWWIGQLEPMYGRDEEMAESLMLRAAYGRLVASAVDSDGMDAWKRSAQRLVQRVDWGEDGVGRSTRAWLMGVVVDPRVRSDRLAVLTRAMVLYSSASGIGLDVVMEEADSMVAREEYLALLRLAWIGGGDGGVWGVGGDDVRVELIARIELLLKLTAGPMDRSQAMERGIELGRVNSACWAKRRDDQAMVMVMIDSFDRARQSSVLGNEGVDLSSSAADERWATDARNLVDSEALIGHLNSLVSLRVIGPQSAHGLVYLAIHAPSLDVRDRAERLILGRRGEVGILIAIDRIAGAERMTRRMMDLVFAYVGREGAGAGGQGLARRLILGELLEAGVLGKGSWVDDFEREMGALFEVRVVSEGDGLGGGSASDVFESMVQEWAIGGRAVPGPVRAGLLVGLRSSRGEMQRSLAYQWAVLGLVAEEVRGEHPVQSGRIDRVMDEVAGRVRGAEELVVQMVLIERALAEIWLIVLETEGES